MKHSRVNRCALALLVALALSFAPAGPAGAHEGEANDSVHAEQRGDGNHAQGSIVVRGTVRDLVGHLYRVDSWTKLFSDVRGAQAKSGVTWSIHFAQFGHAHDFDLRRTPRGVLLEVTDKGHGVGRFEYSLEPVDRARSRLVIRMQMSTPPGFAPQQALDLLRRKIRLDLDDFVAFTQKGNPSP